MTICLSPYIQDGGQHGSFHKPINTRCIFNDNFRIYDHALIVAKCNYTLINVNL